MREVRNLIGSQGAAAASVIGPAEHSRLEECAIYDQLLAPFKEFEQADFAIGPLKFVVLLDERPWHSATLGGQRITRARERLLLHEHLLPRSLPLLLRHDWRCLHSRPFRLLLARLCDCCHLISPFLYEIDQDQLI